MVSSTNSKKIFVVLIVALLALAAYAALLTPDRRTVGQKFGDAVNELPNGPDKAVRQLQDRTPGEKIGDAVKDAGDKIKEKTDR